jgi:hypothetical protein
MHCKNAPRRQTIHCKMTLDRKLYTVKMPPFTSERGLVDLPLRAPHAAQYRQDKLAEYCIVTINHKKSFRLLDLKNFLCRIGFTKIECVKFSRKRTNDSML